MRQFQLMRLALAAVVATLAAGQAVAAPTPTPKLIVAIAVDQFSGNLYDEWRGRFTGGLQRLSQGLVYPAGYQSHAATETCPGHSTLLTGKHPNKTGIVANDVRDPATGKMVYCLYDPGVTRAEGGADAPVGPAMLMADTLGDWIKAVSPASRVVAVSGKDRGAINMAGHRSDGSFWYKAGFGFTTYVASGGAPDQALAPIAGFNAKIAPIWRTRPRWAVPPGCKGLDADIVVNGKTARFSAPPVGYGQSDDPAQIAREVQYSPILDSLTEQAAEHLIAHYRLGKGPATDVLAVSFSGTDYIGHRYGTRGPEMCSQLTSLDAQIGMLLSALDRLKVPYVVVLSADHGGSDFAERSLLRGQPASRIDGRARFNELNKALQAEFSLPEPPAAGALEEVYINVADPALRQRIAEAAKRRLLAMPEIAAAFTLDELLATPIPRASPDKAGRVPDELSLQERFAESTYPGRSPDVSAALQPYMVNRFGAPGDYMSGHGTVWNYDRRVPILFWWSGAPSQTRYLPIETVDIAPTLAALVGVAPPADVDGRCLPLAEAAPAACPR